MEWNNSLKITTKARNINLQSITFPGRLNGQLFFSFLQQKSRN